MMSFAASPGTAVEPMCSTLSAKYADVLSYTDAKSAFIAEVSAASRPMRTESN